MKNKEVILNVMFNNREYEYDYVIKENKEKELILYLHKDLEIPRMSITLLDKDTGYEKRLIRNIPMEERIIHQMEVFLDSKVDLPTEKEWKAFIQSL